MRTAAMTMVSVSCWVGLSVAGVTGCISGPQLVPGSSATRPPEHPSAAAADLGGVRLVVEGDAWPGRSAALARGVTAVLVIVENRSNHTVVVGHDDFTITGASGERFTTVAPAEVPIAGPRKPIPIPQEVFSPADPPAAGDSVSPPPAPNVVPSVSTVETSFPLNQFYIRTDVNRPQVWRQDVEARALAEGALRPGDKRAGFIYFAGGFAGERQLTFQARLERPGEPAGQRVDVAQANIPLRVE